MSDEPRMTIVTISFNQGCFIEDCLRSVAEQGVERLDHIVVDACSTDGTLDILRKPEWSRVQWTSGKDSGPADGLNKGFIAASGEIFGYLNADDMFLPGAVRRVIQHFESHPHIEVLYGDGLLVDGKGRVRRRLHSDPWETNRFAYGGVLVIQQATFFRQSAFRCAGGFNLTNRTCWDAELILDMALAGCRIEYIPVPLGAFRVHRESITGSGRLTAQYLKDRRRLAEKALGREWRWGDDWMEKFARIDTALRRRLPQRVRMLMGNDRAPEPGTQLREWQAGEKE